MLAPIGSLNLPIGGPIPAQFSEVWMCDFEFGGADGERPRVRCMVAKEVRSGREIRMWGHELLSLAQAPFDVGPQSLFVAYYVPAEMGCFIQLGWEMPQYVLDLYCEHRVQTNGLISTSNRLPDALEYRKLSHIDVADKDQMISLILSKEVFTPQEQRAILDYCASDVYGLEALLPAMAATIDWPRALFRGHYMKANAWVVHHGIPIDVPLLNQLSDLCMPVHDGFVICSTVERLDADIVKMRAIMSWAGKLVTGGLEIRVDCKTVKYPDRFMDKRGKRMWDFILGLLAQRQTAA